MSVLCPKCEGTGLDLTRIVIYEGGKSFIYDCGICKGTGTAKGHSLRKTNPVTRLVDDGTFHVMVEKIAEVLSHGNGAIFQSRIVDPLRYKMGIHIRGLVKKLKEIPVEEWKDHSCYCGIYNGEVTFNLAKKQTITPDADVPPSVPTDLISRGACNHMDCSDNHVRCTFDVTAVGEQASPFDPPGAFTCPFTRTGYKLWMCARFSPKDPQYLVLLDLEKDFQEFKKHN